METSEGLRHNQSVAGPLEVTIRYIDTDPVSPRDVELIATDAEGVELQLVIWTKHGVTADWDVVPRMRSRVDEPRDTSTPRIPNYASIATRILLLSGLQPLQTRYNSSSSVIHTSGIDIGLQARNRRGPRRSTTDRL